jgi:mannose-6-phosphate isomerase-like protein (cupin superfamily)|tara:strand:- start:364 stop:915 length:552 start_codon:yes stop_codon:yes gene_type:complete
MNDSFTTKKRRIILGQYPNGNIKFISDEIAKDIITDPARPGYMSTKIWATLSTPANFGENAEKESSSYQHSLIPPKSGSICRFVQIPPDNNFEKVNNDDVKRFYQSINSKELHNPNQSVHPYMHKKNSLDYVYVMSGTIKLILDESEVNLNMGDTVVNIGANHAWSNTTDKICELFISSHDAT